MKKILAAAICIAAFITNGTAQSAKYAGAMKKTLTQLDSAKTTDDLQSISNGFERIAAAEKDQWLPYYYAAYSVLMKNYMDKDIAHIDADMDNADKFLSSAESLSADSSEINTLKAMIIQRRMEVDPQTRYRAMGPKCTQLIKMAEKQNANNPRAWMFDAQVAYYTPPMFGGSKEKGMDMLKKSIALFESTKPASDLAPAWGKDHAQETLAQWSKG